MSSSRSRTKSALISFWNTRGHVFKSIPKPTLDELDAKVRADERARMADLIRKLFPEAEGSGLLRFLEGVSSERL